MPDDPARLEDRPAVLKLGMRGATRVMKLLALYPTELRARIILLE